MLRQGGTLVSLRGLPNGEFARRAGLPLWKRLAFGLVGGKYDRVAAKRGQRYRFVFVHEDGEGLARIPELMGNRRLEASVDKHEAVSPARHAAPRPPLRKQIVGGYLGLDILPVGVSLYTVWTYHGQV